MHVISLSPTASLNAEVPDKILFGKKAKYDHLRVFGYKAFVQVPNDERSKLDAKTRQCIFLGYGEDEFGYRLYDLVEKKCVRSRDVKCMEDQTIDDIDNMEKTTPDKDSRFCNSDPVRTPVHNLDVDENNAHNENQQLGDVLDVPIDEFEEEHELPQDENLGDDPEPPQAQVWRPRR